MSKITSDLEFNNVLESIVSQSDTLADSIHNAGMYALSQVNIHGNINSCINLLTALGRKHDKKRVVAWMVFYGKVKNTKEGLVFCKRKDINADTVEAWAVTADSKPYYDHTPQAQAAWSTDYLSGLGSVIGKHKTAQDKTLEGLTVTENNIGLLPELMALFEKWSAPKVEASSVSV